MQLTLTPLTGIPLIQPGDDLGAILLESIQQAQIELLNGDVLVVAQKIVSKAEGRLIDLNSVRPSQPALDLARKTQKDPRLVELILRESTSVIRTRPGLIIVTHRLGFICANAGIDRSNVGAGASPGSEMVLLLPEDPDRSAAEIRTRIERECQVKIGVLIIDSHGRPWRLGTVGIAIGISGLPGLVNLRGAPDIFGRSLEVTEVGAADELAAGASLVMGQAAERRPVVLARGFPFALRESGQKELLRPQADDLFR